VLAKYAQAKYDFATAADVDQNTLELNLNYIIVQSYPEQKAAEEARDVLAKAGIPTTIEHGLKGFHPEWAIVVTTKGFTRIQSDEYKQYVKQIDQVSVQYAGSKRGFKSFQPTGYKWVQLPRG